MVFLPTNFCVCTSSFVCHKAFTFLYDFSISRNYNRKSTLFNVQYDFTWRCIFHLSTNYVSYQHSLSVLQHKHCMHIMQCLIIAFFTASQPTSVFKVRLQRTHTQEVELAALMSNRPKLNLKILITKNRHVFLICGITGTQIRMLFAGIFIQQQQQALFSRFNTADARNWDGAKFVSGQPHHLPTCFSLYTPLMFLSVGSVASKNFTLVK